MIVKQITSKEYNEILAQKKFFLRNLVYVNTTEYDFYYIKDGEKELIVYAGIGVFNKFGIIFQQLKKICTKKPNGKECYIVKKEELGAAILKLTKRQSTLTLHIENTYTPQIIPYVTDTRDRHLTFEERLAIAKRNRYAYHLLAQNRDIVDEYLALNLNLDFSYLLDLLILIITAFGKHVPKAYKNYLRQIVTEQYPLIYFSELEDAIPRYKVVLVQPMDSSGNKYVKKEDIVFMLDRKYPDNACYVCKYYDRGIIKQDELHLGWGGALS